MGTAHESVGGSEVIHVTGFAKVNTVRDGGQVSGVKVDQQIAQAIYNNYGNEDPLSSLSAIDFTAREGMLKDQLIVGTSQWFFNNEQFQRWEKKEVKALWCPGEAGVGKSCIAYNVALRLSPSPSSGKDERKPNIAVLRAFFDGHGNADHLFGNLINQLADQAKKVRKGVYDLAEDLRKKIVPPQLQRYAEVFEDQAAEFARVFVIVDALDEFPGYTNGQGKMEQLLRDLARMEKVSLMVTARNHIDPARVLKDELFDDKAVIHISAEPADLKTYIQAILNSKSAIAAVLSERRVRAEERKRWHDKIIETVTKAASGIFLLAVLHLQSIQACKSLKELREALRNPPTTLREGFKATWRRLQDQNKPDVEFASQVLAWISYAPRPMTQTELQHALVIKQGAFTVEPDDEKPIEWMISICVGFVVYDGKSIRMLHATAKDFLMECFDNDVGRLQDMARICIDYLATRRFQIPACASDEELNSRLEKNGFLHYAACNWGHHLRRYEGKLKTEKSSGWGGQLFATLQRTVGRRLGFGSPLPVEEDLDKAALSILRHPDRLQSMTQILYIPDFRTEGFFKRFPQGFTPLHVAAHFGNLGLARRILGEMKNSDDINLQDSYKKTALHVAARKGHSQMVKLLVEKKANIEVTTDDGETPLLSAASLNETADVEVMRILVEHKANVMARNKPGGTGLHWASLTGRSDVVELLLQHNADYADVADSMKTVNYIQESPKIMITLLLDKVALAGVKNLVGGTPLHWGSFNGHLDVVKLLLAKAEDVDSKPDEQRLSKKDYINKPNLLGGTALHGAAWNGNDELVEELLKHGANIHAKTVLGSTALYEACLSGNVAIVRVLLKYGADIDAETELMGDPDNAMPTRDDPEFASWLVKRGSEVREKDTGDAKRILDAVVNILSPHPLMAKYVSDALQEAMDNRDDEANWSALRQANAYGFEALTNLLRSINKVTH